MRTRHTGVCALSIFIFATPIIAQPVKSDGVLKQLRDVDEGDSVQLLELLINGVSTGNVIKLQKIGSSRKVAADDLIKAGVKVTKSEIDKDGLVDLERLKGLTDRTDDFAQQIDLSADASRIQPHVFDLR